MNDDESNTTPSSRRSKVVNLRVPMQVVETVDKWVDMQLYKSRSEFILSAIRFYLDYIEYKESYNVRAFQGEQFAESPGARFDRLKYYKRP
ncbi:MAG TPA: ribbon-helix-helix domain-containing protein [Methanomassiliicoccales archaeon]|nr:ribbon-helix-helix domain-containing protein [Methanomassiliicoccales archaeon]